MGFFEKYFMKQYYDRPSRVAQYQKLFQKGDTLVFMKGATDVMIYRGAMALSLVGLTISFYGLYQMALGKMKKTRS